MSPPPWLRLLTKRPPPPGGQPACLACGVCCDLWGGHLRATPRDLARWRAEGRKELLARVGRRDEIWVDPASGERLELCPFLVRTGFETAHCAIHQTKPELCRAYPTRVHGDRCVRRVSFPD